MREVVSIHIGQAGIQIGSACWEHYTIEHGISPDGLLKPEIEPCHGDGGSFQTFFNHTPSGRYVPRSLMVDLEPSAIDEIRSNQYSELFHPDYMLSGNEDAANNFARGYHTIGREMIYTIIEKITKLADSCPSLAGFIIYHSFGGGTGSGLTSLVMEHLSEEFAKKTKIEFIVYPSPKLTTAVVEPYNSILATHHTLENSDCGFLIDNEATYEICARDLDIMKPTYVHVNRLSADIISCITASLRFGGSINVDLREFQTNLVPYPRIHYPLVSYSPLLTETKQAHRKNSIQDITLECFRPFNQFVKCDPRHGKYMACCLLYRGLIPPREISSAINMLKDRELITFVNWCPTGFKVGINYQTTTQIPCTDITNNEQSLCMLANNTCISEAWARLDYQFDLMYAKRAFIHWYLGEGMDEEEFIDARENLAELELEYSDCGMDTIDEGTIVEDEDTRRKTTPVSSTNTNSTLKT